MGKINSTQYQSKCGLISLIKPIYCVIIIIDDLIFPSVSKHYSRLCRVTGLLIRSPKPAVTHEDFRPQLNQGTNVDHMSQDCVYSPGGGGGGTPPGGGGGGGGAPAIGGGGGGGAAVGGGKSSNLIFPFPLIASSSW